MRGKLNTQEPLFSYVSLEDRIPPDHPLRTIRKIMDAVLAKMSPQFDAVYAKTGRPSIPPEMLFKALMLQYLYGIRSEIQLMQQMDFNLLFRWFVGLGIDDPVWTPETFCMNRDRLFHANMTGDLFRTVVAEARSRRLISKDHFSVDGTLLKAWASHKSFQRKEMKSTTEKPPDDFHGEKRSNKTHASTTDPDARLFRKSKGSESQLCYMGHVLMENRNGLAVDREVTEAGTRKEWEAAVEMVGRRKNWKKRITLGADKGYDVNECIEALRDQNVTPHIARRNDRRRSKLDARTTRHAGYAWSLQVRKRIEQVFGWMKSAAGMRQVKVRGQGRVQAAMDMVLSAYNILRISNLVHNST